MAIRKTKQEVKLPDRFCREARRAMYHQVLADWHKQEYEAIRQPFWNQVREADDVELVVGVSVRFDSGLIRWQARKNPIVNVSRVLAAVEAGTLSIAAVLSLVSKWDADALASIVPEAVTNSLPCPECGASGEHNGAVCARCNGDRAVSTATEYGVMQATPDFKQSLVAQAQEGERILAQLETGAAQEVA